MMAAARTIPFGTTERSARKTGGRLCNAWITCVDRRIDCSGLLISCATPETSVPIAATSPPSPRTISTVSCTRPPRVTTSSATMNFVPGAILKPRRSTSFPASSFSTKMCGLPRARATSWPTMIPPSAGEMTHSFKLPAADLKRLIDKTQFAISTEETRYYLNGIYLHTAGAAKAATLRAVATDGHRLAQVELPLPDGAEIGRAHG